ncbi:hypothetical protein Cenrod_2565 [Candidatus Symbiobacter mobilis CR]|uniref:DUF4184 family protein n=2 Tax=Candidatus Symbiobacter TaxID=1436289 RepID=U5NEN6_9BURK|nr:hypothetical protein Cenrod_2565 [Candidatus Symbiobacter mobilis CR]
MGPGLALKALLGGRCSLGAFAVAQVAMDIEPLVGMLRGAEILHGTTHTVWAALLIAALVAPATPWLAGPFVRRWNRELLHYHLPWLIEPETFSSGAVVCGALLGTLTHLALDSVMHADMHPLAPWTASNPWMGAMSIPTLHTLCLLSGVVGMVVYVLRARFLHRTHQ